MNETKKVAHKLHTMGVNITAIAGDGKAPRYQWKEDVNERQDYDRLKRLPWGGYTAKDGTVVPAAGRVGILHSSKVGQWRCFDIDASKDSKGNKLPVSDNIVRSLLLELGLPADYAWCMRSGSGAGWHVYVRCQDDLPAGLTESTKEKGVFVGIPHTPGDFEHIELRWNGVQSVPAFASSEDVPAQPPEFVGSEQVIRAFFTVAQKPAPPAPPAAQPVTKPHTNANGTHPYIKRAIEGKLEDACNRLRDAADGQRHRTRLEEGKLVGGLLHYGTITESEAIEALYNARVPEGDTRKERKAIEDGIAAGKDEPITIEVPAAGPGQRPGPGQPTRAHTPARDEHIAVTPLPLLPVDLPAETLAGMAEDLDKGDSELLAALYPSELRYDHRRKAWFYWNGTHWVLDTGDGMIRNILSTQVRSQYQRALIPLQAELGMLQEKEKKDEADNERIAKLKRWGEALGKRIKTLATTGGCKNVSTFAQSYLSFHGEWNTERTTLPCRNGYVDLSTGKSHEPDPAMSFTHVLPFDYDPHAVAPKWQAFLDTMQPDREMQHYLQSYAGYAATGIAEEICAFFIGNGANGKTTFCNVLGGILGGFCAELNAESLLEQKGRQQNFDLAAVEGARLVVARELPGGTLNASTLKQLVDIGKLHIERKYEQPYDIERTHSLVIYANETPRVKDTSDGTWRRLHLVRWEHAVPEDQRVENYHQRIIRDEAEGVMAWIVQGAIRYLANGLQKPAGVRQATENYRVAEDEIALFIAQCCVTGDKLYTPAQELFDAYREFADGYMSQRAFGKEMSKHFGETRQRKVGNRNLRCYIGVGLLDEPTPDPEDEGSRTATGSSSATNPEVGFKASESKIPNSHYGKVAEVAEETVKVLNPPSREGSMRTFTEIHATSATLSDGSGDISHYDHPNGKVAQKNNSATTRQEAAAARYREEDYRLALLARLVRPDTGREERSRLYAMSTTDLERLVTIETS